MLGGSCDSVFPRWQANVVDPSSPSYEQLVAEAAQLRVLVVELTEANTRLVERVAELEQRLAQNPRNSSRPPSSEGYAKPPPRSRRGFSGRRPGGQPGDEGRTRRQVADPDVVVVHAPRACAGCGGSLAAAPALSVEARQVFDLPALRLVVAEHRLEHRRCAGCGAVSMGEAPRGVGAPTQYGPGVRAVGSYWSALSTCPTNGPRACSPICWPHRCRRAASRPGSRPPARD